MLRNHRALLLRTILAVVCVLAIGFLLLGRIAFVNSDVSERLTPSETPGVWELNTHEIGALPWAIPDSCGMTPGYYRGVDIVEIGEMRVEDYETFVSHVDLPVEYLEFDSADEVEYAMLPLTLRNNSDDSILVQFSDFWLFCGIVPGSCAQSLLPQFNEGVSSVLEPGSEGRFVVVYRILRSGFCSDSRWNARHEAGYQLVIPAYPDKYIVDLPFGLG